MWLVAAERYDEADDVLLKIADWNGIDIDPREIRLRRPGGSGAARVIDARRMTRVQVRRESVLYAISPETINSDLATITTPLKVPVCDFVRDAMLRRHLLVCSLLW